MATVSQPSGGGPPDRHRGSLSRLTRRAQDFVTKENAMATPDSIVLIHGFWVTPRSWEHWKTHYEAKGFTVHTPAYPGLRGRGRGAARRSHPDCRPDHRGHRVPPRDVSRHARHAADLDGSLRRRRVHASRDGPRLRLRRRRPQLSTHRGCTGDAVDAVALGVPGAQEPAEPPPGRRVRSRAVDVCVHQHLHRRGVPSLLRPLPHPGLGTGAVRLGAGQLQARPPRRLGRLQEPRTALRCCSCPVRRTTSCRRPCRHRTPSTTRATARSPNTTSTKAARTSWSPEPAGRRSPTGHSSGHLPTPPPSGSPADT